MYLLFYTQILRYQKLIIAKIIQCSDFEANSLKIVKIKWLFDSSAYMSWFVVKCLGFQQLPLKCSHKILDMRGEQGKQ